MCHCLTGWWGAQGPLHGLTELAVQHMPPELPHPRREGQQQDERQGKQAGAGLHDKSPPERDEARVNSTAARANSITREVVLHLLLCALAHDGHMPRESHHHAHQGDLEDCPQQQQALLLDVLSDGHVNLGRLPQAHGKERHQAPHAERQAAEW
eukprot:CAMPEP_0177687944 /NCGR_PEP_ID=MMETSP0447-20121125/34401_1 /TAXON_ID=0 /ORGANISM="Stygamoeba regulata, Strain BSH-02190019" /LENGTH=153 /DNA_ID=CAMNT_0019198225 /DNA_START=37 /DNA_END=496 /DNA_ORIENTATION=+